MALADNYAPTKTLGNGATLVYSFSWDGISVDFVKVYSQNVATGVITEITTGITKALNSGSVGGTVTFLVAPASTVYIIIARQTPVSQTDPYSTSGGFPAATVENNFDKIVAIQQESVESLSRSLKYPIGTNVSTYSTQLPIPEALKYLRGNAGGNAYENSAISSTDTDYPGTIDYGTDASKPASPSAGDIYFAIDTKIIYVCASSGSWTQFNYSGAFFASLASTPSGAGIIPISNLASGTPDGTKFVKDDGTLAVPPGTAVPAFENRLLHVRDEKAANTPGGTFTGGLTFLTRTLNTVKTNEITGASLASNQITLPAGTYDIIATAPHINVNQNRLRLRNITDSTNDVFGPNSYDAVSGGLATLSGRFTIASQKVFELQHTGNNTQADNGFGIATNSDSMIEVYAEVRIWKVA